MFYRDHSREAEASVKNDKSPPSNGNLSLVQTGKTASRLFTLFGVFEAAALKRCKNSSKTGGKSKPETEKKISQLIFFFFFSVLKFAMTYQSIISNSEMATKKMRDA